MDSAGLCRRFLVVAPNWIGDALMSLPLLAAIKRSWPTASVSVLAPASVARVLARSGLIDEAIETTWRHGGLQLRGRLELAAALRPRKFDSAVILPNSFKSALVPLFAGIPNRVGYVGEARRLILSNSTTNPQQRSPMVAQYLGLAALIGANRNGDLAEPARLAVTSAEITAVFQRFGLVTGQKTVVLCPGAEYGPAKRWPAQHFSRLAELIRAGYPKAQLVVAGSAGDVATAAAIASGSTAPIVLTAGKTSIDDVTALLAGASLVVSNDSGLMHIAAALGRPLVALYGSTDPGHTPPQSAAAQIMWLGIECSPCYERVCPLGHTRCLVEMTPQSVYAAIAPGTLN